MKADHAKIVLNARKNADDRAKGYREQALKMYPWICGRCTREFTHANLRELTVHHRDHNTTITRKMSAIGNCCACIATIMNIKS